MAVNYKTYEFQCYEYIRQMERLLQFGEDQQELRQWCLDVERLRKDLESRRFRVAVVGEFNRGKTSFINALLGKEILPADCMPATATINRITYGDTPSAYVRLKNGQKRHVKITELADYVTKLSSSALEAALKIDEAVVQYPSLFCRNGVDLIDTPGMNDEDSMNQATVSRLEDIDLAVVAVDAAMPFSMTECSFTAQLVESPQICQIVIVITKVDMIRQNDRKRMIEYVTARIQTGIKEYLERSRTPDDPVMEKYHSIFDDPHVFAVSSTDALYALECNDMELFEKSGFLRLNDELPQIILTSQNSNVVFNSVRVLTGLAGAYRDWLTKRKEQCLALIPRLQTIGNAFQRTGEKYCNLCLTSRKNYSFDFNPCHAAARKCFIQALSRMKVLRYDELQRVLAPAVKEAFQVLNTMLQAQELSYLKACQDEFRQISSEYVREMGTLVAPFPGLCELLQPELIQATNSFSMLEDRQNEKFYWTYSPIPAPDALGQDWQVIPLVDTAIRSSLRNYGIRRKQELDQLAAASSSCLSEQLNRILASIQGKLQQYTEQISRGKEQEVLDALQVLEQNCQTLLKHFQAELYG